MGSPLSNKRVESASTVPLALLKHHCPISSLAAPPTTHSLRVHRGSCSSSMAKMIYSSLVTCLTLVDHNILGKELQ